MHRMGSYRMLGWAAVLAVVFPCTITVAKAEGGFFDFLFGQSQAPAPQTAAPTQRERPRARPPAAPPRSAVAPRKQAPAVPKADMAVAVFGDAFAVSIVRGLGDTEGADAPRTLIDKTAEDAGLTATAPPAWDKAIDAARGQTGRLDAAIVMLGSNDVAALADGHGVKQLPGTPGWRALYGDMVAKTASAFRLRQVPLIWVGLPIVRDAGEAQLNAAINEVVQDRAVREGATFVDSWQPFADENGDFSTTGPDVNGRPATLRWTNGWNFTRAGARKLASFVLPDLRRLRDRDRATQALAGVTQSNADIFDQALSIDVNAQILREAGLPGPGPTEAKPGPVLMLTAAPLAINGQLASAPVAAPPAPVVAAHAGRADDFAWPAP